MECPFPVFRAKLGIPSLATKAFRDYRGSQFFQRSSSELKGVSLQKITPKEQCLSTAFSLNKLDPIRLRNRITPGHFRISPIVVLRKQAELLALKHGKSSVLPSQKKKQNLRFAVKTRKGTPKEQNQDSYLALENFPNVNNSCFFAVMDGHGRHGHLVSCYIKENLPVSLLKSLPMSLDCPSSSFSSEIFLIKESLKNAYLSLSSEILNSTIDLKYSGSTLVSVLVKGQYCYCANTGDSRAVLGRFDGTSWVAVALSRDHKPTVPKERQRIELSGGLVQPAKDSSGEEVGPARVWRRDKKVPGLGLSRAIGDRVAYALGVIPDPEIICYKLTKKDHFIVIASDGIWDYLSSAQVVQLVATHWPKSIGEACRSLVRTASFKWKAEDKCIDDITVIVVALN